MDLKSKRVVAGELDYTSLLREVQSPACGAGLLFIGTARQFTAGRETQRLEYEAYVELAEIELENLERSAIERFGLESCRLVHRVGVVELGEASVALAIGSRHRAEAFEAAVWVMDELKHKVPVWKREHWADGSCEWQHPIPSDKT